MAMKTIVGERRKKRKAIQLWLVVEVAQAAVVLDTSTPVLLSLLFCREDALDPIFFFLLLVNLSH